MRHVVSAILGICIALSQSAVAQTRLGLHVTQEELTIWRQRAMSGPYKTAGDVSTNSPGDWDQIVSLKNSFMSNPAVDHWRGYTGTPCLKVNVNPGGTIGRTPWGHVSMVAASFYALVMNDAMVRNAVRTALLNQVAEPGVDFTHGAHWCQNYGGVSADYAWPTIAWLGRLVNAYDYLRSTLSTTDRTTLDTWFLNAAIHWSNENSFELRNNYFPNYDAGNYTLNGSAAGWCQEAGPLTHFGGYTTQPVSGAFNNRRVEVVYLTAAVGTMLNNSTLIALATKQVKEYLMFAFFADGTPMEFNRWEDSPTQGWRYATYTVGTLGLVADLRARAGDTELYTYSTSGGLSCGISPTTGGPKSLQIIIDQTLRYVVPTTIRYGTNQAGNNGNVLYRIDTIEDVISPSATVVDIYMAPMNLWYKNAIWKARFLRQGSTGAPSYPAAVAYPGNYIWMGPFAKWGGVLFMFGQMEGKVWPYPDNQTSIRAPMNLRVVSPKP
jgi:hypothetical protein